MNKINTLIGKLCFAMSVVAVLYREKLLPRDFDAGDCISILMIGFIIMIIGLVIDDIQRNRKDKTQEDQRQKRIKSLYGKE